MTLVVDKEVVMKEVMTVIQKHYSAYETNILEMESVLKQLPFVKKLMDENTQLKKQLNVENSEEHITMTVEEKEVAQDTLDIRQEIDNSVSQLNELQSNVDTVFEITGLSKYVENDNDSEIVLGQCTDEITEDTNSENDCETFTESNLKAAVELHDEWNKMELGEEEEEEEEDTSSEEEEEVKVIRKEMENAVPFNESNLKAAVELHDEWENMEKQSEEEDASPEEEDASPEEEDEEVYEITIKDTVYFTTDEENGTIYECTIEGDVGDAVGKYDEGSAVFF